MSPNRYIASAELLLPRNGAPESRLLRIERIDDDPRAAREYVTQQMAATPAQEVLAAPSVRALPKSFGLNLGIGALLGAALGLYLALRNLASRRLVRGEAALIAALGEPLFATRLYQDAALDALCGQLLEHWFSTDHPFLPVVSALPGEGRSRLALDLARRFAARGEKTLLIDADLRSPSLHRALGLPNKGGLGDLLAGRPPQFQECNANLAALVAGRTAADPLELLRSDRLHALLAAAMKHFRVIIVDTPAATRGPDLQIFAALARGALVVTRRSTAEAAALAKLRQQLDLSSARVVATVVNAR